MAILEPIIKLTRNFGQIFYVRIRQGALQGRHSGYLYYSHFAKDHFYFWEYVKINILFGLY